ncbi:magnesium transporter [Floccifex sp.]|uniref:magnesium transporter n=1 Tax=Floccifex sp. TaxID=2815810 RepID=UPI002A747E15|nr:magnesium transporter [Floccifex sp.]MDD7281211.1 magnesium transporter [Erysipelotrichaceae bacterium]MDY2958251.1 magnesium transporter [Floccifex sp.]
MEEKELFEEHDYVQEIIELLKSNASDIEIKEQLEDYHENDIAQAFEDVTPELRKKLLSLLNEEQVSDVFSYIEDLDLYLGELEINNVAKIIENMDADDAVDLLEEMDPEVQEQLIKLIDEDSKEDIRLIQSYEDDEIGSYMTTNFVVIQENATIRQAMKSVVEQAGENDNIMTIYVIDDKEVFCGAIDLKDLICARKDDLLSDLIVTSYPYVLDHEKIADCIERIKDYAEDSYPVLNNEMKIIGIITSQDVVEVVDDEMGEDYAKLAGLTSEEDLNETTKESMKKRMPWLVALLFLGMLVSSVVGLFESVVSKISVIICFQSLILGMAGNVGTQSLAVTIRVLMDENLTRKQKIGLVFKEARVGLGNGCLLGLLAFIIIGLYLIVFRGYNFTYGFGISGCAGIALVVAMLISSVVGTLVPMFFHKIHVDPAVASGPLISTMNDLVAVITYYGMAWLLLIKVFGLY